MGDDKPYTHAIRYKEEAKIVWKKNLHWNSNNGIHMLSLYFSKNFSFDPSEYMKSIHGKDVVKNNGPWAWLSNGCKYN